MSRGKNTPVMRRGNKPLAWYIGEKLMDKDGTDRETPSPSGRANSVNRKSSMESQTSIKQTILPSSFPTNPIDEKKKRGAKKNPRQRTKRLSANFSYAPSNDSPDQTGFVRELNTSSDKSQNIKEKKEDYWYYDPVSDGFYYEHNGSRGWRRRNPKIHGVPAPLKADENEQKLLLSTELANANNAQQQPGNKFAMNPGVNNTVPSMKYDPNTDGYFYEMASVDGWKRRAPATGTTPPTSSSLKDSNQRLPQQLPSTFPVLPSFLQYSLLNNGTQRLVIPSLPSAQDSNSTTPQALSHAEMEEMVMRMRNDPDNGYCGSLMDGSNSSGNLVSDSLLNRSRLHALSDEFPSNASTTSSISDDMVTPPPPNSRHSSFLHTIHRNNQRHVEHSKAMPIEHAKSPNQSDMTPQNTSLPVGSFDEPYEFYWSDTDKAPSVCSVDENAPVAHDLFSYFNELRIQPAQLESMPFDTFRQRTSSLTMKRPTSLNIRNNNSWTRDQNPEKENGNVSNFNIDKFIEDLPPLVNENILSNLYALRTPIGEQYQSLSDSPLFTPVLPKERGDVWKMSAASSKDSTNNIQPLGRELTSADIGGNPFLYNDLERIWQWPAA
uniref:Uncharacterized protein n=1 Tax=Acrobeloides nanus TaxID=290746 RepID=A0A914DX92_9BILA